MGLPGLNPKIFAITDTRVCGAGITRFLKHLILWYSFRKTYATELTGSL
jgi:hypothetical protein